ncbi:MAG: NAD(P)-binding protein [Rhodobacterales bacterium]|nr:NAD(P)-binding protein [Rhodobacterales bacterium]
MKKLNRRELMGLLAAAAAVGCGQDNDPTEPGVPTTPITTTVPTETPEGVRYLRTNWSKDPFSFGSYSYFSAESPGTGASDQLTVEAPIDDQIYFAGEALNPNYTSSVHAAHESGLRAVASIQAAGHARVAIIGAGMAGLTAAALLSEGGVDVTVIEARDRIGGRINTDTSLQIPTDIGASWIHGPDGNPLTELADQVGMERIETQDDTIVRGAGGQEVTSVPAWVEIAAYSTSAGTEISNLNPVWAWQIYSTYGIGYSGRDVKFPNGYAPIFEALTGDYTVQLSTPVTRVAQVEEQVEIDTQGGLFDVYDAVLVTVPMGVLKAGSISFEPALSEDKLAAIDRMGMGVFDKLVLVFDEPFWDEHTNIIIIDNGLPNGQFNFFMNFHKYFGVPVLVAYNGAGPAYALADKTDEEMVELALASLRVAYPDAPALATD